ncbi:hypothetical protein [Legionella sp. km772]|uniref:hypothetical protein n=1 Tax=Legionella sp. km772 TaxID=2498111 RepID=UPI000F8C3134|nr:hypothetical protein [Legionella sp. km772]RUR13813.1 hypothetical protein ELY15_01285 [Legionella sp. km772]
MKTYRWHWAKILLIAFWSLWPLSIEAGLSKLYGVTITNPWKQLPAIIDALKSLAKKPTARIVFDAGVSASDYKNIVIQIHKVSGTMGELVDSSEVKNYSLAQYLNRTKTYLNTLQGYIDIWEIGNEINGEWLGNTSSVVAKMTGAYDLVKQQKGKTALTLYYNQGCYSRADHEMFAWVKKNIPLRMKQGLDYVFISYYEDDCNNLEPDWPTVFQKLGSLFPNSKLGFGECGTTNKNVKEEFIYNYYTLTINHPRFILGGFWWYFDSSANGGPGDMVPKTKPLWSVLNAAIQY